MKGVTNSQNTKIKFDTKCSFSEVAKAFSQILAQASMDVDFVHQLVQVKDPCIYLLIVQNENIIHQIYPLTTHQYQSFQQPCDSFPL